MDAARLQAMGTTRTISDVGTIPNFGTDPTRNIRRSRGTRRNGSTIRSRGTRRSRPVTAQTAGRGDHRRVGPQDGKVGFRATGMGRARLIRMGQGAFPRIGAGRATDSGLTARANRR